MERLVIFGGTFDPIHRGHLRIAREAALRLNADVVFVPAKMPRWKSPEATTEDRLKMLKLALQEDGSASFSIDECELKRPDETTYSIDTVRYFVKKFPNRELFLLIGADEVNKFDHWHQADAIASLARILYVNRPDIEIDKNILKKYRMISLDFNGSGSVSSSAIRELKSIDIPSKVLNYIETHDLYFMKRLHSYLGSKRLRHSLSVAHTAYAIARKNKVNDPERAYIAGILHDIGKELGEEESNSIMKENFPEFLSYPKFCHHQFTGSYLAEHEFGVKDLSILDAIRYHCTGKAHMSVLAKIIFSADKIEPTRGYDSANLIKDCNENYYAGFLAVIRANADFLDGKTGGVDSNPLSQECYQQYLNKGEKK